MVFGKGSVAWDAQVRTLEYYLLYGGWLYTEDFISIEISICNYQSYAGPVITDRFTRVASEAWKYAVFD